MAVTLHNATKRFDGRAAVDAVSVDIRGGEFFVVLGPSGCGKSTLLRLIAGLEQLDGGRIEIDGDVVADGSGAHIPPERRRVGVVFQSYALWPHMSVLRNVSFPIETDGRSRADWEAEARRHLETVDLAAFENRTPAALSGGQRQRVALARCLAGGARTILMDEPLANLDPHLRAAMEMEIADFHRRTGATTLYITHDQREAMALADRVAVMEAGRFSQVASPEEIYERPSTAAVARFIGRSAILPATLTAVENGVAQARLTTGVDILVETAPSIGVGPAQLVVRPENVAAAGDGVAATIAASRYRGGQWEAECAVDGLSDLIPLTSRTRMNAGDSVTLRIFGAWALPA